MPTFASLDAIELSDRLAQRYGGRPAEYAGIIAPGASPRTTAQQQQHQVDLYRALCWDEAAMIAGQAAERRAYEAAKADADSSKTNRASHSHSRPSPLKYDDTNPDGPTLRGSVPIVRRSPEEIQRIIADRNRKRTT